MKNKMMKLLSAFLTLIVIATSIPTNAFAIGIMKANEDSTTSAVGNQTLSAVNTPERSDDNKEFIETTPASYPAAV